MIRSMTGFGMDARQEGSLRVRVELRSVNHRFFELSFNGAKSFLYLEDRIRKQVRSLVHRGSVTCLLTVAGDAAVLPTVDTNWALVDQYVRAARAIERRSGIVFADLDALLQLPCVFSLSEPDRSRMASVEPIVMEAVDAACGRLVAMREQEGRALQRDLTDRMEQIGRQIAALKAFMPEVRARYKQKLRATVADFLDGQSIDENRLMNEVALFINRTAIDEEVTRMESHLAQCADLLNATGVDPVGRRLDFLIQEMNREMNTIGSKGNHAEVSRLVVAAKTEIEKLREQVQNVE